MDFKAVSLRLFLRLYLALHNNVGNMILHSGTAATRSNFRQVFTGRV